MYGQDIHPNRKSKTLRAIGGHRQHVVLTHNPSTIGPGQTLRLRFPNIGQNDVIVPKSYFISFLLLLTGVKDTGRTVVPNIGRRIIKTLKIRFENNDVLTIENYDEIMAYFDHWLPKKEKNRRIFQGIHTPAGLKLRVGAKDASGDAEEIAISKNLGNRFRIPIDFELLNDIGPYNQASLADKLEIELTFNDAKAVILGSTSTLAASADADYGYSISHIRTEWDQITDPNLAAVMSHQYQLMALPFLRVFNYKRMCIQKNDQIINLNINVPSQSLSYILILPIDPLDRKPFQNNGVYKNLDIKKVSITVEGQPNQLYAKSMYKENSFDQICKIFHENGVSMGEFLTKKYALCLDFRPSTDNKMHGNGLELRDPTKGLSLEIERMPTGTGDLILYVFLMQDAQLNIKGGRYNNVVF